MRSAPLLLVLLCLASLLALAKAKTPKEIYDEVKAANAEALAGAAAKCEAGDLSDDDKAAVLDARRMFVVMVNMKLKAARKELVAAGAELEAKKPFTKAIMAFKAYREAVVKNGADPCGTPIPEVAGEAEGGEEEEEEDDDDDK